MLLLYSQKSFLIDCHGLINVNNHAIISVTILELKLNFCNFSKNFFRLGFMCCTFFLSVKV